ncbi:MAG: hypothetical protein JXB42_10915 [Deltaproteobacteria bacterium]|nr:hypothetical protein [Deltaproteobacteria bacterium]
MPGLIGYSNKFHKYDNAMLLKMQQLLKYDDRVMDDGLYADELICASRTHLGIIKQGRQPFAVNDGLYAWLEGEFYNRAELEAKHQVRAENDCELLAKVYARTASFSFLRDVDGYFAAVVYDQPQGVIYLMTDRYGFKPLYWGCTGSDLVWSSELKGFLGHVDFRIKIDPVAVERFFDVGYLLQNRTWFDGVELMSPASVLAFRMADSRIDVSHYWSWNEIEPFVGTLREDELVEELGGLFEQAVRDRVKKDEKVGITLSGGLDSRAILAAVPCDFRPLHAFTFGQEGCDEITIAEKAATIKRATHHALLLGPGNWLNPRISGVWKTDGMLNVLHMHGIEFCSHYKNYVDIIINGFAGDLVLGGSYLKRRRYVDKRIDPEIAQDIMQAKSQIDAPTDYGIDKIDPYFLDNRVRRFTNTGLIYLGKWVETRQPFFSNALIEIIYSLPDVLRYKSRLYNRLLLSRFPEYFRDIPYQKTRLPIGCTGWTGRLLGYKNRVAGRLMHKAQQMGFKTKHVRHFTDYAAWIRHDPARSFFQKVLSDKKALYPNFVERTNILNRLQEHLQNKANRENEICLALTFEIWLQQIINGRYRDGLS